jgi:hypothetical protein
MGRVQKVGRDKSLKLLIPRTQPLGTIPLLGRSQTFRSALYCTDGMNFSTGNHWAISVGGQGTAMNWSKAM